MSAMGRAMKKLPQFSFCFVCTLVATVLALTLMVSHGAAGV